MLEHFILHYEKISTLNNVALEGIVREYAPIYQKFRGMLDGPIERQHIVSFEVSLLCRLNNKIELRNVFDGDRTPKGECEIEEKIIDLMLNECKDVIVKHDCVEGFPKSHFIKYCSECKFNLVKCFKSNVLRTWKYENFELCEVDNSERDITLTDGVFFETGRIFFGVDLSNMTAYLFYSFGKRWGSVLGYEISVGEEIELTKKKVLCVL